MEEYVKKKALLFSILFFFLCANLAFASSEPTVDKVNLEFQGKVATEKDGFLNATIILELSFDPLVCECDIGMNCLFTNAVLTMTVYEEDGTIHYEKPFPCTVFLDSGGSGKVTSTSALTAELSTSSGDTKMLVQIPGDAITGDFTWVEQ